MTLNEAKQLKYGQIIYDLHYFNADGTRQRFKVNGQVKTWKKDVNRIVVPLKRGLCEYAYLVESVLNEFSLTEEK